MFDAARDNAELPGLKGDAPVAELDDHLSTPDEKKLVFIFVMMPGECAGKLYELQFLTIHFGDDPGSPMFLDERELFDERDFRHGISLATPGVIAVNDNTDNLK